MKSRLSAALSCIALIFPMLACDGRTGAGSSGSAEPSNLAGTVVSPRVAFVSNRDGNLEIFAANADGSNLTRLTLSAGADVDPVWSPDGNSIAFVSIRDGTGNVFIMDADGSNPRNLTNSPFVQRSPTWSPDGAQLAFVSSPEGTDSLYLVNADGSYVPRWQPVCNASACTDEDQRNGCKAVADGGTVMDRAACSYTDLSACSGFPSICFQPRLGQSSFHAINPAWSPTGQAIAFVSDPTGTEEIYLINSDGSYEPEWQPVCHVSECQPQDHEAGCLGTKDGMPCTYDDPAACNGFSYICFQPSLSPGDGADDLEPAWSPSGTQIAFRSNRDGNDEIYVMNADGSNQKNLTNSQALEANPAWSADGTLIAFSSSERFDENLDHEVFVMEADGSNRIDISNAFGDDFSPTWSND